MLRPLRIGLAIIGLCAAVYSTASLSGGWLGTPPWWERWSRVPVPPETRLTIIGPYRVGEHGFEIPVPSPGREAISASIAVVGLALFGAILARRANGWWAFAGVVLGGIPVVFLLGRLWDAMGRRGDPTDVPALVPLG